jgi:hypothetical protein
MNENDRLDPVVQPAIENNPGCLLVSLQSFGLCFIFSIITLLARTVIVKGNHNELMSASVTILIMCPIFQFWFPIALWFWFRGSHIAMVIGAIMVALFNAVVMGSWMDNVIASAG